jgi:hypothetical protein
MKKIILNTQITTNEQPYSWKKKDEQQLIIDSFIKDYNHASLNLLTKISKIISHYETH